MANSKSALPGIKPVGKHKMATSPDKSQSTPATLTPTPTQAKILSVKAEYPDLSTRKIAAITDTDHSTVSKCLTRYGIDYGAVESYQKHRADIFDGLAHRIITSITDSDIKASSLLQRLSGLGIIYDKMRIERGLSDSASKPMVQINIVSPYSTPIPSITCSTQPIDNTIHSDSSIVDVPPNVPPNSSAVAGER
jgi:hypothetical protein